MENQKREELIALYDLYGNLLTDKQKGYFEDYYFMDLSISEIAENYGISRNGVFDQLKRVNKLLEDYEESLNLLTKYKKIESLNIDEESKNQVLSILKE
ncbi:MAG: transcriptional regulator [Erysipelotrichaceae bacterium]|nr:transcriptional regulator [Erysipelotrichaceae bacterium]